MVEQTRDCDKCPLNTCPVKYVYSAKCPLEALASSAHLVAMVLEGAQVELEYGLQLAEGHKRRSY